MFAQDPETEPVTDSSNVEAPTEEVQQGAASMWESLLEALPRIGIALALIVVGWLVARLVRSLLRRSFDRSHTASFAKVMSKLAGWVVMVLATLAALTVAFPSVKPVDLLAGLGFFSIAIGFAFQDILENTLAGVLLLFREPFHGGDQIEVDGVEGTVQGITIRETRLLTYDGKLVIVPNSDVYKNAIVVQTAEELRRDDVVIGVAYEADLEAACREITDALAGVDGVDTDSKAPEALVRGLGVSTIDIVARFWTDPHQHNVLQVRSRVIVAVKAALDRAEIEMPCDIVALQATDSLAAALHGEGEVTPSGSRVS